MHSVARCFSCLTNSTEAVWAWEQRRELFSPSQGAARNRQVAFEVYSWPCSPVRGALTYQLLPGSAGPTSRRWSSCQRKCMGMTEVHVEYTSRGKTKQNFLSFPLLIYFKYWVAKSFFLPCVHWDDERRNVSDTKRAIFWIYLKAFRTSPCWDLPASHPKTPI